MHVIPGRSSVRFIDRFDAIAFDMNGTFMFGHDRLGEDEDFAATYHALGGTRLSAAHVRRAVRATVDGLVRDYADPSGCERFPSLREGIARYAGADEDDFVGTCLDEIDLDEIERVIAAHERGTIPEPEAAALIAFSRTHRLCVVSNLWAHPRDWDGEFERAGLAETFEFRVFSSEIGSIKPSPVLFEHALGCFGLPAHQVLFVGDSLERDIRPAKALGMGTAWISAEGNDPAADRRVESVIALKDMV